jgi:competence protein ComEA
MNITTAGNESEALEDADGAVDGGELESEAEQSDKSYIYVFVCGAVLNPGVYELLPDARAEDALNAAGGFAEAADLDAINLAEKVTDEMRLYFPYEGEDTVDAGEQEEQDLRININTATASQLKELSGIGDVKAAAIIEYRNEHGDFGSTEEIMNVDGIGESLYSQIKDDIRVE